MYDYQESDAYSSLQPRPLFHQEIQTVEDSPRNLAVLKYANVDEWVI